MFDSYRMASRPLQYVTIFLTCFIDILGFGIVIPVLPLYGKHFGASDIQIGLLVGVFSLMQFFFSPIWGKVSDRIGRKPVLLVGLLGTIASYILMGLAQTITLLFVARFISGIAGANIGAAQAYLADISTPENRAKAMGLLGAAFGLGFVFGPALGGWAGAVFNYAAPMYIAAGLATLNWLFVFFCLPESLKPGASQRRREGIFPHLFRHVQRVVYLRAVAGYFLVTVGFSMMTMIFALLVYVRFDLDVLHTGYILGGIGILGVIIQGGLIGRLARSFGEARVALAGAIIMCVGLAGLAFSRNITELLLASGTTGIGNSLLMPMLSSVVSRSAEAEWQGRALGVMQSTGSLARCLGPLLAGGISLLTQGQGTYAFWPLLVASGMLLLAAGAIFSLNLCPEVTARRAGS